MKTFSIAFLAFIALVFNWFFFWLVGSPSGVQWLCWGMFHAALVGVLIFSSRATWTGDLSALIKTPSAILAALTVIVTAAMSFGFIAWNPESPMIPLTGYVILFGAAISLYVSWRSIGASIQTSSTADKSNLKFIRQCVLAVESIIQSESDLDRQKELEVVYDALRSAQVTSIPETRTIETQIESDVNLLQSAGNNLEFRAEIQRRLLDAINKRNQIILANR